ncbi:DNA methyltransferase [uncultured Fibrobacter sp.]|uniref:TRM11 family SAM-dependent methyltransferase n=1 Tax=uncultured Fibrobacter sp. TaxID=261512 RepID=UPI00261FCD8F|nr:DNA methyltransferase [uncultured Fibrobacter sp.]
MNCNLTPENFSLEKTSIWSFPDRGSWATHTNKYRGNWSPYIPRNLIIRYSNEGDSVLDQFVGSGTTLVEAKLLNRNAFGVDINPDAIKLCKSAVNFDYSSKSHIGIRKGNAQKLSFLSTESIDLIATHPPYADIIKYSEGLANDLSQYPINKFIEEMKPVAAEAFRVLKRGKICAFLIGDVRQKGTLYPLGFELMNIFMNAGFSLKEIVIKEQHNCIGTKKWRSKINDFLLLAHEYLYIMKKT